MGEELIEGMLVEIVVLELLGEEFTISLEQPNEKKINIENSNLLTFISITPTFQGNNNKIKYR